MRKAIIGTLVAIALVSGAALIERSIRVNRDFPPKNDTVASGERKPLNTALELIELQTGKKVTLDSFRGKVTIINFWASWCEACMQEMPSLNKLHNNLKGDGLQIIGVNVDDEPAKVVPGLVSKLQLGFPMYSEIDGNLTDEFSVLAIPFTIVVDKMMRVVWSESGERDWAADKVTDDIRKLLHEE